MKIVFPLLLVLAFFSASAQKDLTSCDLFAKEISEERLKKYASFIASDVVQGRETGTDGIEKANQYIIQTLNGFGARPGGKAKDDTFKQFFYYRKESWRKRTFIVKEDTMDFTKGYFFDISTNPKQTILDEKEVIFLGYGIESDQYNDFNGVNVRGKTILFFSGEPVDKNGMSYVTQSKEKSEWSYNHLLKLEAAKRRGAKMVFIIDDAIKSIAYKLNSNWTIGHGLKPDSFYPANLLVTTDCAKIILGKKYKKLEKCKAKIQKKGRPEHFSTKTVIKGDIQIRRSYLEGSNILTLIEGSDSILKNEYVFLTAHYDHLGKKGDDIYNGADDNASGTSALLEVARAFTKAKQANMNPKRSVVIMWVAGEEKGLLGSNYYVENPIYPLKNIVAEINMDMIGRDDVYHEGHSNYVYTIGSTMLSMPLDSIVKSASTKVKIELDYRYNKKDDPKRYYYRSDHYNFAKNGIPSVFFFDGGHDDYHRPSDTVDKLNYNKIRKIAQLAFYTIWKIADRQERLPLDVEQD